MQQLVPLISSGTAGPLGVLHLPRFWQKVRLEAAGRLKAGYPGYGKGYDTMVVTGLGLDPEATVSFIKGERPTYPAFEAWVKAQPGVNLTVANIYKVNESLRGYCHDDATRKGILGPSGIPDDGSICPCAIDLNNLDDWKEFHDDLLAAGDLPAPAPATFVTQPNEPVVADKASDTVRADPEPVQAS